MREYAKTKNDINVWKGKVEQSLRYRRMAEQTHGWRRFIGYLSGRYAEVLNLDIPVTVINDAYAYVKTAVSSLYFKDPYITVNAKRKTDVLSAVVKEQIINYRWRSLKLKRHMKRAISEAKTVGHAWFKVGYTAEIDYESEHEGTTQESIKDEKKWAIHVPFDNMLVDRSAKDFPHDSRWMCHHFDWPVDVVKAMYGLAKDAEVRPSTIDARDKATPDADTPEIDMTTVYEIWDKDSGYRLTYCDGYEEWLQETPPVEEGCIGPYKMEGFPFACLKFNDFPNSYGKDYYPVSDIEIIEPQILEQIKLHSMAVNHVKRYNRQLAVKRGTVTEIEKEKFVRGIDGSIIETEGDPGTVITPIPYPPLQTDIYAIENRIAVYRDRVSGQAQYEQGGPIQTKTGTAAEVDKISTASAGRRLEQVDIVEDFCEEVARKILALDKQFTDIAETISITGEIPYEAMQELADQGKFDGKSIVFTKDDIQGEEDVSTEMGSTVPMNKENRMNITLQMLRYGVAIGLQPGSFASIALGKQLVKDMGLINVEKAYDVDMNKLMEPKQPDPRQQMDLISKKQAIDKGAVDIELKKQRTASVNLGNLKKAIDNNAAMEGAGEQVPGMQ